RGAAFLTGLLLAVTSCGQQQPQPRPQNKTIKLGYTSLGTIAPRFDHGDDIEWQVEVTWDPPDQSPCEDNSDKKKCKIKKKGELKGTLYSYKCAMNTPCDPEILLDDGTREPPFKLAAPLPANTNLVSVRMVCDGGYAKKKSPNGDIVAPSGSLVLFGVTGD